MYIVDDFYKRHESDLSLTLVASESGLKRKIMVPEVHRPGLGLAGYLKTYSAKRVIVFGRAEILYLRDLKPDIRKERLKEVITEMTPFVVVARRLIPPKELIAECREKGVALFRSPLETMDLFSHITLSLRKELSPKMTCHGTLVEVFGVGMLIQGDSSVGKSEAALGLIEQGHRLISDDVVHIRVREGDFLEGSGPELTRHLMEIRGIGIINVAHLYGAVCVREHKSINIIVKLEVWDDGHFYDRIGLEEKYLELLGIKVPLHTLPLKPGRDIVLLLETLALNHRLKKMGLDSAKEFNKKLQETIASKQNRKRIAIHREVDAKS